MKRLFSPIVVWCILSVVSVFCAAQQPVTGTPPLSTIAGGPFDAVNLSNLDVHFSIPVFSRAGKGMPFFYNLTYDSLVWSPVSSTGAAAWTPVSSWGWAPQTNAATGYVVRPMKTAACKDAIGHPAGNVTTYGPYTYVDTSGTSHLYQDLLYYVTNPNCIYEELDSFTDTATDGSGLQLYATRLNVGDTVTTPSGIVLGIPSLNVGGSVSDPNGNTITIGASGTITDTLGTTALTITGTPPSAVNYTYTAPSGAQPSVQVTYHAYTVTTQFGVSGIGEYNAGGINLVDRVTLPDGSYYQFLYEATGTGQPYTGGGLRTGHGTHCASDPADRWNDYLHLWQQQFDDGRRQPLNHDPYSGRRRVDIQPICARSEPPSADMDGRHRSWR